MGGGGYKSTVFQQKKEIPISYDQDSEIRNEQKLPYSWQL